MKFSLASLLQCGSVNSARSGCSPMSYVRPLLQLASFRSLHAIVCGWALIAAGGLAGAPAERTPAPVAPPPMILATDLGDLWNGSWVAAWQKNGATAATIIAAGRRQLEAHRKAFGAASAEKREWQLAVIIARRGTFDRARITADTEVVDWVTTVASDVGSSYTAFHEELFQRDSQLARQQRELAVLPSGANLRTGALLAGTIAFVGRSQPDLATAARDKEILRLFEACIEDYIFSYHNGTRLQRHQIHTHWQQSEEIPLQAEEHGLQGSDAHAYGRLSKDLPALIAHAASAVKDGLAKPVFVRRQTSSPAVNDVVQILTDNHREYETLTRWFAENGALMSDALVTMSFEADPYYICRLDPQTLESTDSIAKQFDAPRVKEITERRRLLLRAYFETEKKVRASITAEVARRRAAMTADERAELLEIYERIRVKNSPAASPKK
jgi:hypothetical protein